MGKALLRQRLALRPRRDRHQQPGALAVEPEVLGTRRGDHQLRQPRGEQPRGGGVFLEPVAEALIGEVDERHRALVLDQRRHLVPLRQRQVGAGRVVTRPVQQHHVARLHLGEVVHHAGEIHRPRLVVEIAVLCHVHAEMLEDRRVVGPGRCRQPDRHLRRRHLDELQRLVDRPGPAGLRRTGQPLVLDRIAQHQARQRLAETRIARKRGIGLGGLALPQLLFRRLHRPHHRRIAGGVLVDADAQIDLVLARVGAELGHQRNDLVGGQVFEVFKHQASPVATARSLYMPHSAQEPS